ncbi:MAG TPA: fibronectin type III domain-containing protein [Microbacterium sp.]|uniref:fibronectin type III domain-containing protein n=1 Tax=Microbacterium sp. TaxID=51671 RepID=UPI002B48114A|nr:fibronectin type III domain-containing protein [Microbacterium sp.]HKT57727.1 fibronectin type III domain-containing protein [Microbacterium sp.]
MLPRWTRPAAAVLALALVLSAPPAFAASLPARVGLVSFTGASLTSSGATLTIAWPAAAGATSYVVFASTSFDGVTTQTTPVATSTRTSATITHLLPGRDYFVQVRGVSAAGRGAPSLRVGHGTIAAEASASALASHKTVSGLKVMTWNICSNACSNFTVRRGVINTRIAELAPGVVGMEEGSKYTTAPSGYAFGYKGQNVILYRTAQFTSVKKGTTIAHGAATFASVYASAGHGVSWAALRNRANGAFLVVFDVHLRAGTTVALQKQREYEAGRLGPYIAAVYSQLKTKFGSITNWANAGPVVVGDFNTNKSHPTDTTQSILRRAGWLDSFDQAHHLTRQHYNSANPTWSLYPVIGERWGDDVDKLVVKPSHTVVLSWANVGKMSGGRFVAPLGSDHHPLMFVISVF